MNEVIGVLTQLPQELGYLVAPAMKYGIHQTDDQRYEFLQHVAPEEMQELSQIAERVRLNEHYDPVGDFLDRYPITEHAESANLYFLFGILDEAGLRFEPENWNTVDKHIKTLGRRGSFRLASNRMHAAKFLAEFGEQALSAIPHLRRAVQDEDFRVRIWAHYALAILEGDVAAHEAAVRKIFSGHEHQDELGCFDDIGSEADAALEKLAELRGT